MYIIFIVFLVICVWLVQLEEYWNVFYDVVYCILLDYVVVLDKSD